MERRKASFEDHMNMVSQGHQKTAAAAKDGKVAPGLLDKLAAELNLEGAKDKAAEAGAAATEKAQADAPKSEGEKIPGDSSVSGANAAVVAATDAVALPQVVAQGGNVAEVVKGETPPATKPAEVEVSDAAGTNIDQNSFGKTDEAVAAASRDGGGAESASVAKEAEFIGQKIAQSFQATLEKNASDQEFAQCLEYCKTAGLLDGYNIKAPAGLEKTAEVKTGFLDKIAARQPLSREDIIGAAYEYEAFEKAAADADAQGREEAHALVELLTKVAEGDEDEKDEAGESKSEEAAEEKKEEAAGEEGEEKKASDEKVAALLKNPKIVDAIRTLKGFDLL